MINSWHYNDGTGKSLITEMVSLLNDSNALYIYIKDDCFIVDADDVIEVGAYAMMISYKGKEHTVLLNTHNITHIELIGAS